MGLAMRGQQRNILHPCASPSRLRSWGDTEHTAPILTIGHHMKEIGFVGGILSECFVGSRES